MDTEENDQTARAKQRIGQVLRGKWRIDSLLGVGGMAAVYAATHRNQKRGAVKILHAEVASQPDAQSRFVREGYVANSVDHEGVVSVLDDDVSEDGCAFLVMDLLKGDSVATMAERMPGERMPPALVISIADQVLSVLEAAHDKRVVHRDLKPENLFVTMDGKLKVLDFGIAKLNELAADTKKTQIGLVMGTPGFMSPEQALGEWDRVDARSDLWAVGATMFVLLTGRSVHQADTLQKLLLSAMTKTPDPLLSVDPTLPEALAAIVDRALSFDPADRYQNASEMRADLVSAFSPLPLPGTGRPSMPNVPDAGVPFYSLAPVSQGTRAAYRLVSPSLVSPSLAPATSSDPALRLRIDLPPEAFGPTLVRRVAKPKPTLEILSDKPLPAVGDGTLSPTTPPRISSLPPSRSSIPTRRSGFEIVVALVVFLGIVGGGGYLALRPAESATAAAAQAAPPNAPATTTRIGTSVPVTSATTVAAAPSTSATVAPTSKASAPKPAASTRAKTPARGKSHTTKTVADKYGL